MKSTTMALCLVMPMASALMLPMAPLLRTTSINNNMRATSPKMSALVDEVKDAVLPSNIDQTLRNAVGLQAFGWGVGCSFMPQLMMSKLFGVSSLTAANLVLIRGLGVLQLVLGKRICSGGDASAASTGFLFFAAWTYVLRDALAAGTLGGLTASIMTWNAVFALVTARRQGGLYDTIKSLDTAALSSLLPRDTEKSTRNLVGLQLLGWSVIALLYQDFLFGPKILGVPVAAAAKGAASTAAAAAAKVNGIMATGLGIANSLLGGRTFAAGEKEAAATGAVVFGTWAVLGYLAKQAGVWTGQFVPIGMAINAATAGYCVYQLAK